MVPIPIHRPRRLRRTAALRRLVRETRLDPAALVLPLFVRPGEGVRTPVSSMPGVAQTSVDVPPMSRAIASEKPASSAILAAPTTPPAGPESKAREA